MKNSDETQSKVLQKINVAGGLLMIYLTVRSQFEDFVLYESANKIPIIFFFSVLYFASGIFIVVKRIKIQPKKNICAFGFVLIVIVLIELIQLVIIRE